MSWHFGCRKNTFLLLALTFTVSEFRPSQKRKSRYGRKNRVSPQYLALAVEDSMSANRTIYALISSIVDVAKTRFSD